MSAYRDSLIARRNAVAAQIKALSQQNYDLPNASAPSTIDFVGQRQEMRREVRELDEMIAAADGGFEIYTEADCAD